MEEKKTLLGKISKLLLVLTSIEQKDKTKSGIPYVIFVLADGSELYIDQDGFATLNEEEYSKGEHMLANGNIIVIDENSQFVETKEPSIAYAIKHKINQMQDEIDSLSSALEDAQRMVDEMKNKITWKE